MYSNILLRSTFKIVLIYNGKKPYYDQNIGVSNYIAIT